MNATAIARLRGSFASESSRRRIFKLAGGAAIGAIAISGVHDTATAAKNPFENIRVIGRRRGKRVFVGQLDIKRFVASGGNLYAVGTLSGRLTRGQRTVRVPNKRVRIPVTKINGNRLSSLSGADVSAQLCSVLTLVLGPLDLNLLGLRVQLNQINLRITAIPGGGLLGDLLCAVANLLSGGPLGSLVNQLARLLNRILGLVG